MSVRAQRLFILFWIGACPCVGAGCDDAGGGEPADTAAPQDTDTAPDTAADTAPDEDTAPDDDDTAELADAPGDTEPDEDVATPWPELEARPVAGRWFAGDLHVHATGASNDAGDESTPEHIREVALARGLDFVVLTDHSNSTGSDPSTRDEDPALFNLGPEFTYWDTAAALSDASFLMIDGNEMSPRAVEDEGTTGHVGCYPRDLTTFDPTVAFTDRPRGTVTGAQTLQQAHDAGCFTTVNHPYAPTPWIAYDWTSFDYDAMEIYNGGASWDSYDYQAVLAWACDLAQGRQVTAVGGSDNHRVDEVPPGDPLDPPLGWPTTWVWAESLEWSELVASLDAGRVNVSDTGVPLELDVYDADGSWLAMIGGRFPATDARWLRVRGEVEHNGGSRRRLQILALPPGACTDTRVPGTQAVPEPGWQEVHAEWIGGRPFEVVVELAAEPGWAYLAWLHMGSAGALLNNGIGLTNPVWAE